MQEYFNSLRSKGQSCRSAIEALERSFQILARDYSAEMFCKNERDLAMLEKELGPMVEELEAVPNEEETKEERSENSFFSTLLTLFGSQPETPVSICLDDFSHDTSKLN